MLIDLNKISQYKAEGDSDASNVEKMAIGFINSHLWYKIQDAEYIFEADTLSTEEYLPQYPISSITKIEQNTGDIFDSSEEDWETIPSTDYRTVGTAGKLISRNYIGYPVKVTYRAGFIGYTPAGTDPVTPAVAGNVPDDIETAIILLSKYFFDSSKAVAIGDLKSETVDGDKVDFQLPAEKMKIIEGLLAPYHRYDVYT